MSWQKKMRNLDDLAVKAGVSAATVSLALRNSPRLSQEVRDRINQLAREHDFIPRSYKRRAPAPSLSAPAPGPLLVIYDEEKYWHPDSVRDLIMPSLLMQLNDRRIEYKTMTWRDIAADASVLDDFPAVLYYNDPLGMELPPEIPGSQIFGWAPLRKFQDRINTNDRQVAELAADYLCRAGIDRAAICWCREMLDCPDHPRIEAFFEILQKRGIPVTALPFRQDGEDLAPALREYLDSGSDNIGFFGWNAYGGFKLCCMLDRFGLMEKYGRDRIVICDHSPLLYSFTPRPALIDLNIPMMVELALEAFLRRAHKPEMPGTVLLLSPELIES